MAAPSRLEITTYPNEPKKNAMAPRLRAMEMFLMGDISWTNVEVLSHLPGGAASTVG